MIGGPSLSTLRDLQTLFDTGTSTGLSDGQLLERFGGGRDAAAESAFQALVQRHGPMVLRVCRNVLPDPNDVHDAFQATFLVLVRRCRSIRNRDSVGSWLYGVASRVAARARVEAARRRSAERRGGLRLVADCESTGADDPDRPDFGPAVQEEVRRLPEKYRAVVLLCYWQDLTHEQAAAQLGIPLGTVRSRIARARDLLRRRLVRRGITPSGCESAPALDAVLTFSPMAIPNDLLSSTIKAGAHVAAGRALTDVASASVAALVQGVLRSLIMMKFKTIAICLMFIGTGVVGAILAAPQDGPARPVQRGRADNRPLGGKVQPAMKPMKDYSVEPPDLLIVEVLEALPGRPIAGERLVRPDGKISLGFYGEVYVAGLTIPEVKEKIVLHMCKYLSDETLGLVEIDGSGVESKRISPKDTDRVSVDVMLYNSKNYYVQGEVADPGRLPVTGNDTILDALNYAGGLTPQADHAHVVLYRSVPGKELQSLPVNIDEITIGNDPTTNYQLQPGDRLVIPTLRRDEPVRPESEVERRAPHLRLRRGEARYFDRNPRQLDGSPAQSVPAPSDSGPDRDALNRVERRLGQVERKLDMILKALESGDR